MSIEFFRRVIGLLLVLSALTSNGPSSELLAQEQSPIVPSTPLVDGDNGLVLNQPMVVEEAPNPQELLISPTPVEATIEEVTVTEDAVKVDSSDKPNVAFGDWLGYNSTRSDTTWLAGEDFGLFSLESFPTLEIGQNSALLFGAGFHFLNGPTSPDMPPRLFDFQVAYHIRKTFASTSILDLKVGVGAFSDFEGSARKGVRFPGHAVSYYQWHPRFVSVLGIESLDRDDVSVLPVGGFVLRPVDELVFELVFPRPRINLQINADLAMYFGAELGGGTWAIDRPKFTNDNVTYRDLRIVFGLMSFDESDSVLEIGWAFDRSLKFRSGTDNTDLDGALILRARSHF